MTETSSVGFKCGIVVVILFNTGMAVGGMVDGWGLGGFDCWALLYVFTS